MAVNSKDIEILWKQYSEDEVIASRNGTRRSTPRPVL